MPKLHNFRIRKPTPDNWYPTFDDGCVEISGSVRKNTQGREPYVASIIASGDDDFSLEKEFHGSYGACVEWYRQMKRDMDAASKVNQKRLLDMGFVRG